MTTNKFISWLWVNTEEPVRAELAFESWRKEASLFTMQSFWKTNSPKVVLRLMAVKGYRPKMLKESKNG